MRPAAVPLRLLALLPPLLLAAAAGPDGRWVAFSQPGYSPEEPEVSVASRNLVVILALRQRSLDFLEERARAVSDPLLPTYGQYYARDEVNSIARPSDEDVRAVREFLADAGGSVTFSTGSDLVRFVCNASCVERTFGTKLLMMKHPAKPGDSPFRASTPIRLPERVASALDGVSLNAPIFMPRRPVEPAAPAYRFPSQGRLAPRINPSLIAGDKFLSLRFAVYCKDGSVNGDSLAVGICSSRGSPVASVEIVILQHPTMQKVIILPATADVMGERGAKCEDGVHCVEFNATIGAIQNFARTTARIRTHFADGTVTPFSDPGELKEVFPLPYTTPTTLSEFYGIPLTEPVRHPQNVISVAEFLGQFYNPVDLEAFFRMMGIRSWGGAGRTQPQLIGPDKPVAGSVFGGEAQLDLQYIMALAPNVTTWFWSVPGKDLGTAQEPFLDWLMQVADTPDDKVPLIHSVSYGDDAMMMPAWYKKRINEEFMKLALRGITVLIAAGDDGSSGALTRTDPSQCKLHRPEFPASSPWVVSVGGTQLAKGSTPVCQYTSESVVVMCDDEGEVVCSSSTGGSITTGGGFAVDFEAPWYQQGPLSPIREYLEQTDNPVPDPDKWFFNKSGRAYPDVSLIANGYLVWMGDHFEPTSGTSASTPLLAAMIARLNEDRLQNGLPPVGLITPLLYRVAALHPEVFNDVVMGDNRCGVASCCETGFGAARGWDAASGFGSLNLPVLRRLLQPGAVKQFGLHRDLQFAADPVPRAAAAAADPPLAVAAGAAAALAASLATAIMWQSRRRKCGGGGKLPTSSSLSTPLC